MIPYPKGKPTGRTGLKSDRDLTNAEKIIYGLIDRKMTVATAESITAGGFGQALTRVPGSSRVYKGGVIVYTKELKKQLLGITDELLNKGLVTPELSLEMARRTLDLFNVDYAVGVTGNAGPTTDEGGGGVGEVYWAVCNASGKSEIFEYHLFGNRDEVRMKAVANGLRNLRDFMDSDDQKLSVIARDR
ncbi:MAG: CinA family protein [bacterium]|nr:CinA family protein [bacterium]